MKQELDQLKDNHNTLMEEIHRARGTVVAEGVKTRQQAKEVARVVEESAQTVVAETASTTQGQLQVIHGLVNSDMTRIIEDKLGGLKRELIMMRLLASGAKVGSEALVAIDTMEQQIAEVTATLLDRLTKAAALDDQIASQSRKEDNA
jgi:replicative DNA helicase